MSTKPQMPALPRPAHIEVHKDSQGFEYWNEPFFTALQSWDHRAADGVMASAPTKHPDTVLLDFLADEYLYVSAFAMPTGAGDAVVGWTLHQEHMGAKGREEVARHYRDDLRAAIREAMQALGHTPPGVGGTFWLIERGANQRQSPTMWWSSAPEPGVSCYSWVESVHKATRFDSAEAAEAMAKAKYVTHYAVTSHNFVDAPGVPAVQPAKPVMWRYRIKGAPDDWNWQTTDHPELARRIAECKSEEDGSPAYDIEALGIIPPGVPAARGKTVCPPDADASTTPDKLMSGNQGNDEGGRG